MELNQISRTTDLMEQVLNLTTARQRVLAHNLANINTPGFVRRDIPFEETLRAALDGHEPAGSTYRTVTDDSGTFSSDGNNIELEREMSELTKNRILHQIATQFLGGKLRHMRMAISGRSV